MLTTAIDECRQGRVLEVMDILAGRARYLAYLTQHPTREGVSKQYLTYREEPGNLTSAATEDAAFKMWEKERKREAKLTGRAGR